MINVLVSGVGGDVGQGVIRCLNKSDLELLSNSIKCLDLSGVKNYKVDLGNVGIVREFILEKGFGNSIAELILNNLGNFNDKDWEKNLIFRAKQLNLIRHNNNENDYNDKYIAICDIVTRIVQSVVVLFIRQFGYNSQGLESF